MTPEDDELLHDLLDGRLDAAAEAALRRRLADEPDLRGAYEKLEKLSALLRSTPDVSTIASFADRVMARIEIEDDGDDTGEHVEAPAVIPVRRFDGISLAAAMLSIAATLALVTFLFRSRPEAPEGAHVDRDVARNVVDAPSKRGRHMPSGDFGDPRWVQRKQLPAETDLAQKQLRGLRSMGLDMEESNPAGSERFKGIEEAEELVLGASGVPDRQVESELLAAEESHPVELEVRPEDLDEVRARLQRVGFEPEGSRDLDEATEWYFSFSTAHDEPAQTAEDRAEESDSDAGVGASARRLAVTGTRMRAPSLDEALSRFTPAAPTTPAEGSRATEESNAGSDVAKVSGEANKGDVRTTRGGRGSRTQEVLPETVTRDGRRPSVLILRVRKLK